LAEVELSEVEANEEVVEEVLKEGGDDTHR